MIITIDGPAASGKSTVAQMLAARLGYYYLNTGFLYRAVAYIVRKHYGDQFNEQSDFTEEQLDAILALLVYTNDEQYSPHIFFDGTSITEHLKTAENDRAASRISTSFLVRQKLLELPRRLARKHSLIVEGRDAGSVVFPDAAYKFFLTAGLEERARRWRQDQKKKGRSVLQEHAIAEIEQRDKRDKERDVAPLCIPSGAVIIDATTMRPEEVVEKIVSYIQ